MRILPSKLPKRFPGSTVAKRKAYRTAVVGPTVFEALGGREKGITPKAASRYTIKERKTRYITTTVPAFEPQKVYVPGHWVDNYG